MAGQKRRFSTVEKEGAESGYAEAGPSAKGNQSKSIKNKGSPESGSIIQNEIVELIQFVKDKNFVNAKDKVAIVLGKTLTPSQTRVVDHAQYFIDKSNGYNTSEQLNGLVKEYPLDYAVRLVRFQLEDSIDRLYQLEDGVVLELLSKKYTKLSSFSLEKHSGRLLEEERAVHLDKLHKMFPSVQQKKDFDIAILESTDGVFGIFYTHPFGYLRNSVTVDHFQQMNEHLSIQANECKTDSTPKKKSSGKAVPGPSQGGKGNVKTRSMITKEREEEKANLKLQMEQSGHDTDPWEGVPDFRVISSPENQARRNEICGAMAGILMARTQGSFQNINTKKVINMKIHLHSLQNYGDVFQANPNFYKLLRRVDEQIRKIKTIAEIMDLCNALNDSEEPFGSYFADYVQTCVLLASGDIVSAKIAVDSALLRHEMPARDKDPSDFSLRLCLVNSLWILKAVTELCSEEYFKCYDCIIKVLDSDCANSDAHNLFAKLLLECDQEQEAMRYMKESGFVLSMHSDPVKTIFNLMVNYYENRHVDESEPGPSLETCGALTTVNTLKENGQLPSEMLMWMAANALNILKKRDTGHYAVIQAFFGDMKLGKKAKGSTGQMLKRVVQSINKFFSQTRPAKCLGYEIGTASIASSSSSLTQRRTEILQVMRNKESNYFIQRFFHSFIVDDWLEVTWELFQTEIDCLPDPTN